MPFKEDTKAFFETGDFATRAKITFQSGATARFISIIFDATQAIAAIYDTNIEANVPQFMCQTSDLIGVRTKKDSITIDGKSYLIERIEADGTGVSTAYLKKI